jgi:hypothetical protein
MVKGYFTLQMESACSISPLKMAAPFYSKTSINLYQTTPCHIPENSNLSELSFYFDISGGSIVQFMEGLV